MDNRAIGERLLRLRQEKKLTQVEFSRQLGVSQPAYKNYERGEREIPTSILLPLFHIFKVDPLWVLTGSGTAPSHNFELLAASGAAVEIAIELAGDEIAKSKKWEMIGFVYSQALREGAVNEMLAKTLVSIGGKSDDK